MVIWLSRSRSAFSGVEKFQAIKKAPSGALFFAHEWLSPAGYTSLPMRALTTRIIFCVMVKGVAAILKCVNRFEYFVFF
jgi:hypothetical protein